MKTGKMSLKPWKTLGLNDNPRPGPGRKDADPTDPEWESHERLFMNYLICCLNPSPHVSTATLSTFPRHSFKYHGKQSGGRLFKRGDDLSSLRLAQNNHTSVFRCPVHRYGDAAEMWEENSQKVIYEMSFQPVKTVQCHEARSISSTAHFFVT